MPDLYIGRGLLLDATPAPGRHDAIPDAIPAIIDAIPALPGDANANSPGPWH